MRKLFILFFANLFIISFLSCKKHVENKIEGDWRQVNVVNPYSDEFIDWTLKDGNFYIIHSFADSTKIDTQAYGQYVIKDKLPFLKRILSITNCTDPDYKGDWRIMKLNTKEMEISIQKADMIYYEFTKN